MSIDNETADPCHLGQLRRSVALADSAGNPKMADALKRMGEW